MQSLFGWNDSKMQQNAAKVTFANKQSDTLAVSWMCTNGKTHSGSSPADHPPARRRDRDEQGRQGHRLDAKGVQWLRHAGKPDPHGAGALHCPAGSDWDWMSPATTSSFTSTNVVQVTDGTKTLSFR